MQVNVSISPPLSLSLSLFHSLHMIRASKLIMNRVILSERRLSKHLSSELGAIIAYLAVASSMTLVSVASPQFIEGEEECMTPLTIRM